MMRSTLVGCHTDDDRGYSLHCNGDGVAKTVQAKLKEKNT